MPKPTNVLLITTDQMRRDHMGCGGNPVIRTPNLDRLAAGGVVFDRAYVNNPVCMPNRCTIATGRVPANHRCWANGIDLPEEERTVADELNDAGYHTALLGKAHFQGHASQHVGEPHGLERGQAWERGLNDYNWTGPFYGFQYVQLSIGHGYANLSRAHQYLWTLEHYPEALDRQFDWDPSPTGCFEAMTPRYDHRAHSSNFLGHVGSDYLRARATDGQPFMAWVSFPDPHHPFSPPRPYDTMYDPADVVMPRLGPEALADKPPHFLARQQLHRDMTEAQVREMIARTYGMISLVDENIGKLLDVLDATGLADNTVVIFTADHGDLMADAGLLLKGPWLLEGLINVPMIWRVPGGSAQARSAALMNSADITPTILQLLGLPVPRAMDGLAMPNVAATGAGTGRDAAFVEYKAPEHGTMNLRTVITADRKLTCYQGESFGELYDMTAPAPEAVNHWSDPAWTDQRRALLRRLLDEAVETHDERLWPTCHA